MSKSKRQLIEV